jgi:large subunit ribosomal protein L28
MGQCALSGKKVQFGNNVSHSKRRTRRKFDPNIQKVTLVSDVLGCDIALSVSTRALRTVQKHGGLDPFLLKMTAAKLAPEGQRLQRLVKKAMAGKPRVQAAEAG